MMNAPNYRSPKPDKMAYSRLETDHEFRTRIYVAYKIDVAPYIEGERLDREVALHHPYPQRRIIWIET